MSLPNTEIFHCLVFFFNRNEIRPKNPASSHNVDILKIVVPYMLLQASRMLHKSIFVAP